MLKVRERTSLVSTSEARPRQKLSWRVLRSLYVRFVVRAEQGDGRIQHEGVVRVVGCENDPVPGIVELPNLTQNLRLVRHVQGAGWLVQNVSGASCTRVRAIPTC